MKKQEVELGEEEENKRKAKKVLTLFLLFFPSILIAMTATIDNIILRLGFQISLLFFQLVLLSNMLDSYYI